MPEIRGGEEGVEEGRKEKGEVEEGIGKEKDKDGKGGGEVEKRDDGGVKEGVEEGKEGSKKRMTGASWMLRSEHFSGGHKEDEGSTPIDHQRQKQGFYRPALTL